MRLSNWVQKKNLIFLIGYGLYILSMSLEYTTMRYSFDRELQLMRYVSYGLFLITILLKNFCEKRKLLTFMMLFLAAAVQAYGNGLKEICFLLLILLACDEIKAENALRLQIVIQIVCLMAVVLLCVLGILENGEFYDHGTIRYTMGFVYINGAGTLFFSSEMAWLYLRKNRLSLWNVMLITVIWGVIYYYTDLRTLTLLGVATVIVCYLLVFCKWNIHKTPFRWFFVVFPVFMGVFSWGLQQYYNIHSGEMLMEKLNDKLNGRLRLAKNALENYGVSWWGNRIKWVANTDNLVRNKYNYVDCSYIKNAMDYGIIIAILFLVLYCYVMYRLVQENNRFGCLALCFVLIGGFMMPILTSVNTNPLLLLAGGIFHGKPKVHQT